MKLDPIWAYPAAAACWDLAQRYPDSPAWEQGDALASILVHVAHAGPAALAQALKDPDALLPPADFESWAAEATRLFRACGVSEDFDDIRDRHLFRASPYHVHVALDPEHPMFDPRNIEEVGDGFVSSIDELGEAIQVCLVTLHEDGDGIVRLYSRDGGRRTRGVRAANLRRLATWYRHVGTLTERKALLLGPPAMIRTVDCKAYLGGRHETLVHTIANDGRRDNSIAKEAADVWALVRQNYTPGEIARAKVVSEKHVADLLALQRLDPTLWDEFTQGKLPPTIGYRLGRESSKERQRDAWRVTAGFRSGKARLDAIHQWLTEGTLPSEERRRIIPPRVIAQAANRLRGTAPELVVDVLDAVSGDRTALSRLPEPVRVALTSHAPQKSWAKLGIEAEVAERWREAGVTEAKLAKALQDAGLAPTDLRRRPSEAMFAHAREYGLHTLELGEDELQRLLDAEDCSVRTLLDNFLLDARSAALMLEENEDGKPKRKRARRASPTTPPPDPPTTIATPPLEDMRAQDDDTHDVHDAQEESTP